MTTAARNNMSLTFDRRRGPLSCRGRCLACFWLLALLSLQTACNRPKPTAPASQSDNASDSSLVAAKGESEVTSNQELMDREREVATPDSEAIAESTTESPDDVNGTSDNKTDDTENSADLLSSNEWSHRRLVALAAHGPLLLDLQIRIGANSLESSADNTLHRTAEQLLPAEDSASVSWAKLLELPLVQSGWLGNLVSEESQRSQLIAMYDVDKDAQVSSEELEAFLSRGLSRTPPLRIVDIGSDPTSDLSASPWGPADQNRDFSMDAEELSQAQLAYLRFDANGDRSVSYEEVRQSRAASNSDRMNSRSMLQQSSVVIDSDSKDSAELKKQRQRSGIEVLQYYTFLEGISREQWSTWSDAMWSEIDANLDQTIDRYEIVRLFDIAPHARIGITLPEASDLGNVSSTFLVSLRPDEKMAWSSHQDAGLLIAEHFSIATQLSDSYVAGMQQRLRQQLAGALKNDQLKSFLAQQMQLSDNAFEVLDPDSDQELSDIEFQNAWSWLSSRQGSRVQVKWMLSADPWFQLADLDGNQRISELEFQNLPERIQQLDKDQDEKVTPSELPLMVRIEVERTDSRLAILPGPQPQQSSTPPADEDWFSAMDANLDGTVSRGEFLGSRSDFSDLDSDGDGFVTRSEVYLSD